MPTPVHGAYRFDTAVVPVPWVPGCYSHCHRHSNNKLLVVQVKDDGYEIAHDGNCITVFSAPNYCDQMGNKGAFITFTGGDMSPQFTQFSAVPHPDVKPMAYASSMMGNMWGF